jgi:hypothetical protein
MVAVYYTCVKNKERNGGGRRRINDGERWRKMEKAYNSCLRIGELKR